MPAGTPVLRRGEGLRLLWVATKAPWPSHDGGRLLQLETLRALGAAPVGAGEALEVELVAPVPAGQRAQVATALARFCTPRLVDARPWPLPLAAVLAAARGWPVTAARHRLAGVRRAVETAARASRFDLVHAEQVQAMPQALAARLPVVLRAQNVESELWRGGAARGGPAQWLGPLRRREAARLLAWEGEMVGQAALTLAVSERDAAALAACAPAARIETLPAPFPAELPAGPVLPGSPAVTLLAGAGWGPNRDGAEAFLATTWPRVRAALPAAILHVFGEVRVDGGRGVVRHASPSDPAVAFAAGSILAVPLAVASGVRMKALEAWARGVPVVATPPAAAGLAATSGEELLVAEMGEALAAALVALGGDGELRARLISSGRELLRRRHHPPEIARRLRACYAAAAAARG